MVFCGGMREFNYWHDLIVNVFSLNSLSFQMNGVFKFCFFLSFLFLFHLLIIGTLQRFSVANKNLVIRFSIQLIFFLKTDKFLSVFSENFSFARTYGFLLSCLRLSIIRFNLLYLVQCLSGRQDISKFTFKQKVKLNFKNKVLKKNLSDFYPNTVFFGLI